MNNDILIAYYSWHGNTRKVAEQIADATGGTLFEIEPVQPYSTDYGPTSARAKDEIRRGVRPELRSMPELDATSTVFVGTPIWCGTMAPPVATFLGCPDLSGKTVVPFCTHGGGGSGSFGRDVAKLCPSSTVARELSLSGDGGNAAVGQIRSWLDAIRA
jgi:flavodoxin